jgi:simple sugar transport system ATP-binding protein
MSSGTPLLELQDISKYFGNVTALEGISTKVLAGQVTCVLGDNGAGKSTFIKIISGLHKPSKGKYMFEGEEVFFESPREARARGIATVYQDLAVAPLMSVWRNFFLGSEPVKRFGPIKRIDAKFARETAKSEMFKLGIDVRDIDQPVGTMSGGERQSVAIARAVYYGAKVLILDEPTSALGVRQSDLVLQFVRNAAERGLGVILITHNPQHALPVGDRFLLLNRGQSLGQFEKHELTMNRLVELMSGRVRAS